MKTLNSFLFSQSKPEINFSFSSLKEYLNRRETKILSLVSYWGVETVVNIFTVVAFLMLAQYALASIAIFLMAYHTYAVLGTVGELTKG
jgi:cellulose synthase/poly-beta-1,6-N-acetylglucosamine synthase-like glycosyltransferase